MMMALFFIGLLAGFASGFIVGTLFANWDSPTVTQFAEPSPEAAAQPAGEAEPTLTGFAVAGRRRPQTWRERRRILEAKERKTRERIEQWRG